MSLRQYISREYSCRRCDDEMTGNVGLASRSLLIVQELFYFYGSIRYFAQQNVNCGRNTFAMTIIKTVFFNSLFCITECR